MKKLTTCFVALLIFTVSCQKENSSKISHRVADKSSMQTLLSDANELAGSQAVRIGKQVWKIKDLTTSYYRNGDKIPHVQDGAKWSKLTTGAWCWYNNDPAMGRLYNGFAVIDQRGLAPEGWHIPSAAEWDTLSAFLGGYTVAGGKMKETGTSYWQYPNIDATNSSGFSGLPGGNRKDYGALVNLGYAVSWWSSSVWSSIDIYYYSIYNDEGKLYKLIYPETYGASVRCLKD